MEGYSLIERSTVAKDWHARGFSCGMWIDHAGREWACRPHQTEELLMVMSGIIEVDVEGRRIRPSIGEEVQIPPGVPHTIKNIGGKTARWLYGQRRESTPPSLEVTEKSSHMTHVTS